MAAFMRMNSWISLFSAVASWLLAAYLVVQLLSGTFDGRTCQTACVNTVFWVSFTIAGLGLIFSAGTLFSGKPGRVSILSSLALLGLCGIYTITIVIGTLGI